MTFVDCKHSDDVLRCVMNLFRWGGWGVGVMTFVVDCKHNDDVLRCMMNLFRWGGGGWGG